MQNSMMRTQTAGAAQTAVNRPAVKVPVTQKSQRVVKCAAKKSSENAPNQVALKMFGALAAAQLALTGPAMADLIPETIKSQAARDELNRRTSNLPSLGGVAKGLNEEFGESTPQEVGKEIAKNTPDVDLTQNPKDLANEAGEAVKDAGKEAAKQSPLNFITMLDLPNPQDLVNKITGQANDAAGQAKGAASDAAGSAKGAAAEAKGKAASVAKNSSLNFVSLMDLPSPQELVGKITGQANDAAGQAKGAASDAAGSAKGAAAEAKGKAASVAKNSSLNFVSLMDLPSPQELAGKITGQANDAAGQAKGAASDAAGSAKGAAAEAKGKAASVAKNSSLNTITLLDIPSGQELAGKAKGAVNEAKGKAQQAGNKAQGAVQSGGGDVKKVATQGNLNFISLMQLPSPQELAGKITGAGNDAAGKAKGAASDAAGSAKGAASEAQGAAKSAVKKAPVSTLTFALANPAGNAQEILGKAKGAASDAQAKAKEAGGPVKKAKTGTEKAAQSAKVQIKGATGAK